MTTRTIIKLMIKMTTMTLTTVVTDDTHFDENQNNSNYND
jgi:hypothetical protein